MNTRLDDNRVSSLLGNASTCLHGDAIGDITPGRVMRHARRGVVIARPFSEPSEFFYGIPPDIVSTEFLCLSYEGKKNDERDCKEHKIHPRESLDDFHFVAV